MAFVIRQKSLDAQMQRHATTMQTPRTTMALASSWMYVEYAVAMASPRVRVIATATCSMLVGSAVAMASQRVLATATATYSMPAVFVVDRA